MGEFTEQTLARVPPGFEVGEPLRQLLEWIEHQGYVGTAYDGDLYGVLDDRHRGPAVSIAGFSREKTSSYVASWFGDVDDNPSSWLWPFAETGADGSVEGTSLLSGRTPFVGSSACAKAGKPAFL